MLVCQSLQYQSPIILAQQLLHLLNSLLGALDFPANLIIALRKKFIPTSLGTRLPSHIRRSSWIHNNLYPRTTLLMHSPASLLGYETGGRSFLSLTWVFNACHTEGKVDIAYLGYHANWCTYSDLNAILVGFGSWYSFIIVCTPETRPPGAQETYNLLHQQS